MGENLRSELRTLRRLVLDRSGITREEAERLRAIAAYLDTPEVTATEDANFILALVERLEPKP